MQICLATRNSGKIQEISALFPDFQWLSLADIHCHEELPEPGDSLEGDALAKAQYVYDRYQIACLADDTGLEVAALGGGPGPMTAFFGGPEKSPAKNMARLLAELEGLSDRSAQFHTVACLALPTGTHLFHGYLKGSILSAPRGEKGFGYDPIFLPEGEQRSLAQMEVAEKNQISHRAKAMTAVAHFLSTYRP